MQKTFEDIKKINKQGMEFWSARDLMPLLGYHNWEDFTRVIHIARIAADNGSASSSKQEQAFLETGKTYRNFQLDGGKFEIKKDFQLSRYACFLVAQHGDRSRPEVIEALRYFAQESRKHELLERNRRILERVEARQKLKETEKEFSDVLNNHGVNGREIAEIRAIGDVTLFGHPTRQMKKKLGISKDEPLADYLPTITLKAKDLATEITAYQTNKKELQGKQPIKFEHIHNNKEIRNLLTSNGIFPEDLEAEEDIKKLEQKFVTDQFQAFPGTILPGVKEMRIDICHITEPEDLIALNDVLDHNPGETTLKIYYGDPGHKSVLTRGISLTTDVYQHLEPFLVRKI